MTIAWRGDAMAYAKAHVDAGIIRVDRRGCVWRVQKDGRPCAPHRMENPGGKGYLRVSLWIPTERRLAIVMAHKLVYEVKVGPIPEGLQINHKNLIKDDNRPSNLEPMTGSQNVQHSYDNGRRRPWSAATEWRPGRPRLTPDQIETARSMRSSGAILREVAERLNLSLSHTHRITK